MSGGSVIIFWSLDSSRSLKQSLTLAIHSKYYSYFAMARSQLV